MTAGLLLAVLGGSDCEAIGHGLLTQPVNALSSLGFVAAAAGLVLWARRHPGASHSAVIMLAAALVLTGVGSFDYHGTGTAAALWLHDLGVASLPLWIAVFDLSQMRDWAPGRRYATYAASLGLCGLVLAVAPRAGTPVAMLAAAAAVAAEVAVLRGGRPFAVRAYGVALGSVGAAAVINVLTRTGAPLCDPASLVQGHGIWHLLTAAAITAWASAALVGREAPALTRSSAWRAGHASHHGQPV